MDPDGEGVAKTAQLLALGQLIGLPTETVYGLAADARNGAAVASIYAAKGRPSFNPLIVHVADVQAAEAIGLFDDTARRLAHAFWPGPLTLVVPLRPDAGISGLVTAGLDSVAVRVPAHPVACEVLAEFGGPVAAPSANPSGRVSPTTADHVIFGLGASVAAVLDAGPCDVGVESTIVACLDGAAPALLRAGGVPQEALEDVLGLPLVRPEVSQDAPKAPGQLLSHYAPIGQLRLNVTDPVAGETVLGFGPVPCDMNLSEAGDLAAAAAALFEALHALDAMGASQIAVTPIPDVGLGRAINDRLRRAAAPRG